MCKQAITIFFFCLLLYSCTGLKNSQVEATKDFAIATKGISRVPSDIYFRIYQLKSESQTLQLNTILSTNDKGKESIDLLKEDYAEKIKFLKIAEEYSASYMIVEQYANLVMCLLDNSYLKEFSKSKEAWKVSFDRLVRRYNTVSVNKIPSSVSSLTANIIQELGKLRIGQLQKKYLKEAIHVAREPFENICDDYMLLDSLKIKSELANLPGYLDNNYANFLENIRAYEKQGNNPYYYYSQYTPIYSSWLNQVEEITSLSSKTMEAFRKLKTAFGKLEEYVNSNRPGAIPEEINVLMTEYGIMIDTYKSFQNQRVKLNASSLVN